MYGGGCPNIVLDHNSFILLRLPESHMSVEQLETDETATVARRGRLLVPSIHEGMSKDRQLDVGSPLPERNDIVAMMLDEELRKCWG